MKKNAYDPFPITFPNLISSTEMYPDSMLSATNGMMTYPFPSLTTEIFVITLAVQHISNSISILCFPLEEIVTVKQNKTK